MTRSLGVALYCAVLSMMAPPAHAAPALEPLDREHAPWFEGVRIVPAPGALEVRMTLAAEATGPARGKMTFQLLGPRGERGPAVASAAITGDVVLRLRRPRLRARPDEGAIADGDLRLVVERAVAGAARSRHVALVDRYLQSPRLRVLTDDTLLAGTPFAPRVLATLREPCAAAPCTEVPLEGAPVEVLIEVDGEASPVVRVEQVTDALGTLDAALAIPDRVGKARVVATLRHDGAIVEEVVPVELVRRRAILVSVDKPLYQPGHTIHLRLLARDVGTGLPVMGEDATFTIHDAKGNKLFQRHGATLAEGVFATTFELAHRVNEGRWRIEAQVGEERVERTVEVKSYVLPKFRVQVSPDRTFSAPGAEVSGTVRADYFFGKPVAGGKVRLVVTGRDVDRFEIARLELSLDAEGASAFRFRLPEAMAGIPEQGGGAPVELEARVEDGAGQVESGKGRLVVSATPLRVVALAEAGHLIRGIPNAVFVVVTRPDGAPVERAVVEAGPALGTIVTDATGVARGVLTPNLEGIVEVPAHVRAPDGAEARVVLAVGRTSANPASVLLRPSHAMPAAGDAIRFEVFGAGVLPRVFVDVVRDGQTLATFAAPLEGGKASIPFTPPADLAGTLLVHAFALAEDGSVVTDTRPVVVRPADTLRVRVEGDRERWRPGETARLGLTVTDAAGRPAKALLGVQIVDEAVFALSDAQPGLEQVFFYLREELLRPKVEFHAFEPAELFLAADASASAAAVLAAAAMTRFRHAVQTDSRAADTATSQRLWEGVFERRVAVLDRALRAFVKRVWRAPRVVEAERLLAAAGTRDGVTPDWFGVPFRLALSDDQGELYGARLTSAGRDGVFGTDDDLSRELDVDGAMEPVWQWVSRGGGGQMGIGAVMAGAGGGFVMGAGSGGTGLGRVGGVRVARVGFGSASSTGPAPRLRAFFPETLFVEPLLHTDDAGRADLAIPLADSITSWRMSILASDALGRLGSQTHGLQVTQDFFVDVGFPAGLTRGDEVSVPVAIHNHLGTPQDVEVVLEAGGGLELAGQTRRTVRLEANEVKGLDVPLVARAVGQGRLRVTARGGSLSDAVERTVAIAADGVPVETVASGMVRGPVNVAIEVPEDATPGGDHAQVKLYPGSFAMLVDGLENMLRMPSGCFEQTSSTTYPNILVLRYLRDAKKSRPELEAKALAMLQAGWQRLVTFEVQGGGFSWFGEAPANQVLTAYGLMEFVDMHGVMPIDPAVIARTRRWLVGRQLRDGSWKPDEAFLHAEAWGDIQKSSAIVTAWIAWSLARSRPDRARLDAPLRKALAWLERHADKVDDAYVLSYIANAFAEGADGRPGTPEQGTLERVLGRLAKKGVRKGEGIAFPTRLRTATYGGGVAATVEVTALSLRAFMKASSRLELLRPGLDWLVSQKDAQGNWHTTQATIQALQALVASIGTSQRAVAGSVAVRVNGAEVASVEYRPEDFDVVRFVDVSAFLKPGGNHVEIIPSDGLELMHQTTATSHLPWARVSEAAPRAPSFEVDVAWDRTTLGRDETATMSVTVRSNLPGVASMGMLDLGIPPGFDVVTDDLDAAVARGLIQRYELAGRQVIHYVPEFRPERPFELDVRVTARFPLRASGGGAMAWEYYDTTSRGLAAPIAVTVR